jgi:KipI family sensor histidine kinase inhibitor
MARIEPLGDRAFLARFDSERHAADWAFAIRALACPGVDDVVLAYDTAAVFADPDRVDLGELEATLRAVAPAERAQASGRLIEIPVLYDGEDLPEVAERLKLAVAELVRLHAATEYQVFAIGFQPGFPYAGYLPEALSGLARREPPRVRVPAGSVAIAGRQTGIYPNPSPGGWHLLGRTPLRIVDAAAGHFPIRAGDRIRFVPVDDRHFDDAAGNLLS